MSHSVEKHIEGHYKVELAVPEETWIKIMGGKLMCDDVTVLSIAISQGLIVLMKMFGRPDGPEQVT